MIGLDRLPIQQLSQNICSALCTPDVVTKTDLAVTLNTFTDKMMGLFEKALEAQLNAFQRIIHETISIFVANTQQSLPTSSAVEASTEQTTQTSSVSKVSRTDRTKVTAETGYTPSIDVIDTDQLVHPTPIDLKQCYANWKEQMNQTAQKHKTILHQTAGNLFPCTTLLSALAGEALRR